MVQKHTKTKDTKGGKVKKNLASFKGRKSGEEASKRIQEKLSQIKKGQKQDEESASGDSGDEGQTMARQNAKTKKRNEILNDPFLQFDEDGDAEMQEQQETAEEKRLRMANQIIKEYGRDDKADFFEKLHAKTQMEEQIIEAGDDAITRRMKMYLLEKKGKLFYKIAHDFTGFSEFEKDEEEKHESEEEEESKVLH